MCGIAAILTVGSRTEAFRGIFRMASSLIHRGPDGGGFVFLTPRGEIFECQTEGQFPQGDYQPAIAMGFRRLSIIDLSPSGNQPMCNEDRTLWLIFNGEVYNYVELVSVLKERGHVFRSSSDSEVILHAYEEWGMDCVTRFNGMWAFALWDSHRQRLFCSRDRFGVKPLFYFWDGEVLCVASEPKAIIESGLVEPRPHYPYLFRFLTDSILQDGEHTFYEGIRSLLPAHSFVFENGNLRQFRYWDYDDPAVRDRYDFSDPPHTFRDLFVDAVRVRLRSDVPIGACLSGGLDSSSIVGTVAGLNGDRSLDTFSAVFDSKKNDEREYMRYMADACDTRDNTIEVDANDLADVMQKIVWHLDGPCLSASTYPFWKVSQLARQKVKVLLDGQGADELLGGYLGFFPACIVSSYRASLRARSLRRLAKTAKDLVEVIRFAGWRQPYFLYRDYSYLGRVVRPHRWILGTEKVINQEIRSSVDDLREPKAGLAARKFTDELNQILYEHHSGSSLPGLLQYGDGISMAHSLEARLPFMDYRLVEFCFALPPETKIRGTTTKWLLRQSMRGIIPDRILDRKGKIGFATPFADWIRNDLRDFVMDTFNSQSVRDHSIFDLTQLQKVLERHLKGQIDMSFYIWRWMTTALWFQQLDDLGSKLPLCSRAMKDPQPCVSQ